METKILWFGAGFVTAMLLSRTDMGRSFITGGNKFFTKL